MSDTRQPFRCTGGFHCKATTHVHGCFADRGKCDRPNEHLDIYGRPKRV